MSDLDQSQQQPQIADNRRLSRRDDHQLSIDTATGLVQTPALLRDLRSVPGRGNLDRIGDIRQHHSRALNLILDTTLNHRQLLSERRAHPTMRTVGSRAAPT
jgi:hypothetical protein